MKRARGRLLRTRPYVISKNGDIGLKVTINELSGMNSGDKVYQEQTDEGIILLIPEKIYLATKEE